jgi:SulP family sulfate permease
VGAGLACDGGDSVYLMLHITSPTSLNSVPFPALSSALPWYFMNLTRLRADALAGLTTSFALLPDVRR